jgi:small neutral amino acid transporter SnatA (MarC family)
MAPRKMLSVGPKIALVPFLDATADMDNATRARVVRKMITTASVVAAILLALGEFLSRLLHFSTGALSIAGGIVLLIIAVTMVLGTSDSHDEGDAQRTSDPLRLAVFPLAVPYLLNPAGFVTLVTISAESDSRSSTRTTSGRNAPHPQGLKSSVSIPYWS